MATIKPDVKLDAPPKDLAPDKSCECVDGSGKRRNLIVCIDGTSNQFGAYVSGFLHRVTFLSLNSPLEHKRRRTLQPDHQRRDPTHLL